MSSKSYPQGGNSKIKMQKLKSNQDIIEISLKLKEIGQGRSRGVSNALVRPYRVLINKQKKVGRVAYVFYQESSKCFRIFGSFCYSSGGRLLFFPGVEKKKLLWDSLDLKRPMPSQDLDHFTLEADWKNWHITTLEKKQGKR